MSVISLNIYDCFKSEQATNEVSSLHLEAGAAPPRRISGKKRKKLKANLGEVF